MKPLLLRLLLLLLAWRSEHAEAAITPPWRPIVPTQLSTSVLHRAAGTPSYRYNLHEEDPTGVSAQQSQLLGQAVNRDHCALYKIVMSQQLYFEYIYYKIDLPDLKEFTLCMWTKFANHTNDHPLFSYAVDSTIQLKVTALEVAKTFHNVKHGLSYASGDCVGDQPRSILSWIANTQRSSYYMMNVDGHNLYRLNYPLRLNKWYHSCQSWNGRTGEWQIWVNDERVGRGFNNRLVGHVIKRGGIAISGQEQRQLGGGFLEDEGAPAGSGGMLGELTMVQLYGVALTAGKAHRDHKHHHAHHFEHDISNSMPPSTISKAPVTGRPLTMSPYITGGQLNHQVKINPGAHIQIIQNGVTLRHPSLPPPAEAPQLLPPKILSDKMLVGIVGSASGTPINNYSFADRRYRDDLAYKVQTLSSRRDERRQLWIQQDKGDNEDAQGMTELVELQRISKREAQSNNAKEAGFKEMRASGNSASTSTFKTSDKMKRDLVFADGSFIDDSYIQQMPQLLTDSGSSSYFTGLASYGLDPVTHSTQEIKPAEREPAESEVRRVMNICDGCTDEPFEKALIISWRNVPKKLYSGALHVSAVQACKAF